MLLIYKSSVCMYKQLDLYAVLEYTGAHNHLHNLGY